MTDMIIDGKTKKKTGAVSRYYSADGQARALRDPEWAGRHLAYWLLNSMADGEYVPLGERDIEPELAMAVPDAEREKWSSAFTDAFESAMTDAALAVGSPR